MDVGSIENVMQNFIKDSDNAILLTGTWGIGKTYHINRFMQDKKYRKENKYEYLYISLFGKKSLDEVNTELYNMIQPKSKKVLNVISSVVKLITASASFTTTLNILNNDTNILENKKKEIKVESSLSIENQIKHNENKKLKKRKKHYLIIIDDFERKSESIINDDFLGYVNGLIMQGFKIVVLADLKNPYGMEKHKYNIKSGEEEYKISKVNWSNDILGEYKEKVFDRIYNIDSTTKDVIKDILKDNNKYAIDNLLELTNNNLRFICKANNLFNKIKEYIESNNLKFTKYSELFTVCCYVIIESLTNKFTKLLKQQEKNDYEFVDLKDLKIIAFDQFVKDKYFFTEMDYVNLIYSVTDIYENNNFEQIKVTLSPKNENTSPLLKDEIFYYSDNDKKILLKEQYLYLLNANNLSPAELNALRSIIKGWYEYFDEDIKMLIDENRLFEKLNKLNIVFYKYHDCKSWDKFVDKYNSFLIKIKEKEFCNLINSYPSNDFDYDKVNGFLLSNNVNSYISTLIQTLQKKNFLINKIHGSISPNDWRLAHDICSFFSDKDEKYRSLLYEYLVNYREKYPNDKSLKERIESLISRYLVN